MAKLIATFIAMALFAVEVMLVTDAHDVRANPAVTVSRYTGGTLPNALSSTTDFYNRGCNRASGSPGTVILAFGAPTYHSTHGWGTTEPASGAFRKMSDIEARVKSFAHGVYSCRTGSTNISMIVGTSNDSSLGWLQSGHGSAWAAMVKATQDYIVSGTSWAPWVNAYGGSDIEPGFGSVTATSNWFGGYTGYASARRIYNFGSADGCPQSYTLSGGVYVTNQTSTAGGCNNGWTQENVYYMSWGHSLAYSVPAIYYNLQAGEVFSRQAVQWERIVRYANVKYSRTMAISGALVQAQACSEVSDPDCSVLDNTPTQGYDELWNALNYLDGGSGAQTPNWLTDISWLD